MIPRFRPLTFSSRVLSVALLLLSFGAVPARAGELPGTDISYWKLRRGEIRATFRFTRETLETGVEIHHASASDRGDFSWIVLECRIHDLKLLGRKISEYLDPPVRRSVASALGGTHRRSVVVQQPRPYAFRNRRDETPAGRALNRDVMLMAELARVALPEVSVSRSRVQRSSGMVVHDPYLDWLVRHMVDSILERRHELQRGDRVLVVRVDPDAAIIRLEVRARGLLDVLGEEARERMESTATEASTASSTRGSKASLVRVVRAARSDG